MILLAKFCQFLFLYIFYLGLFIVSNYQSRIEEKLTKALDPIAMTVDDESHLHQGHSGAHSDGEGQTHFKVRIVSKKFSGQSRIDRQRLVYKILALEMQERIHALSLLTFSPDEVDSLGPY